MQFIWLLVFYLDDLMLEYFENSISKLEMELRTIDPSNVDFSVVVKGIGKLFSPVTKYFNKIQHEEENIEEVISSLIVQRNTLSNDNITLELEIDKISDTIKMLNLEYEVGVKIKDRIQAIVDEAKNNNEDSNKISFYEDEVLTPLEKKLYDIKEVIIVNEQSVMAMELIRKNNKELIRNVDRIKNVTLVAVNTAVAVAKSLYNQKIILKKMDLLNDSTEKLITKTGNSIKTEAYEISKEIDRQGTSIDSLKNSFEKAFSEIAEISLANKQMVEKSEEIIQIKLDK